AALRRAVVAHRAARPPRPRRGRRRHRLGARTQGRSPRLRRGDRPTGAAAAPGGRDERAQARRVVPTAAPAVRGRTPGRAGGCTRAPPAGGVGALLRDGAVRPRHRLRRVLALLGAALLAWGRP